MPASQSEAPSPRVLSAEAEAEKFSFPFRRKNRRVQNKKAEKIFLRGRPPFSAAGRSEWIFSEIFDKIGSSEIINILYAAKSPDVHRGLFAFEYLLVYDYDNLCSN